MNSLEVIELIQDALFLLLKISTPIMLVALVVGLLVALFQALTQIQEMTLTFVPKIIAIFFCAMMMLPWMLESMTNFMDEIADKIITIEDRDSE
jgi:flagellar biosynthetic protein FliQ